MVATSSEFWDRQNAIAAAIGLTSPQKCLLYALSNNTGDNAFCWPSIATLGKAAGLSERAVQTNLRRLVEAGVLLIKKGGGKVSNHYRILVENLSIPTPAADAPPHELHRSNETKPPHDLRPSPAQDAPDQRTTCTPPPQQMRPTSAPDAPKHTCNTQRTHKEHTCGFRLSWKELQDDDVRRILATNDVDAMEALDREGVAAFSWPDSEADHRNRMALWHSSLRFAKRTGGSPAKLLKAALKSGSIKFVTQADEDSTRAQRRHQPAPDVPTVVFKVADEQIDMAAVKARQIQGLAALAK